MKLKWSSFLLLFVVFFITNTLFAQSYNNPESAVYDSYNNCYYVSNKGDGKIIKVDASNTNSKSIFNSDLTSVRGLAVSGNVLIAAANEGVVFIDTNSGIIIQTVPIPGMGFLNDIVVTNKGTYGTIYVSDSGTGAIYGIEWVTYIVSTLTTGLSNPNGLFWDYDNDRLINVPMIPNAPILAVSLSGGSVTQLKTTTLNNPDGIARDMLGNYYISYWGDHSIYRFNNDFSSDPELISNQHAGPADIFFRTIAATGKLKTVQDIKDNTGILIVPNFNDNTVDFNELTNLNVAETKASVPKDFQLYQNFPNPFNPNTTIFYDVSRESNVKLTIFDILGREIIQLVDQIEPAGSRSINWNGRDYTGNLVNAGIYIYQIESNGYLQTKKMVLLK